MLLLSGRDGLTLTTCNVIGQGNCFAKAVAQAFLPATNRVQVLSLMTAANAAMTLQTRDTQLAQHI